MAEEKTSGAPMELYTYIAIPVDALQPNLEHCAKSFSITPNLLLKCLPTDSQDVMPVTVNEEVLTALTKYNMEEDKTNFVRILNLTPKTGEKLSSLLQNSLRKVVSDTNDNSLSTGTKNSVILKLEENRSDNKINKEARLNHLSKKSTLVTESIPTLTKTTLKCAVCKEVFDKKHLFRKHMKVHMDAKKFKCEQCSVSYNVEDNLKIHMVMHSKGDPFCPICHRKFQRLAGLKAHLINHEIDETFTCSECLTEFIYESDFIVHMESHREKPTKVVDQLPLTCSICTRLFNNSDEFKEHIAHHIKMKKLITNIKKPKKRLNLNIKYRHICHVCKKSFSKYCFLERHIRIHTGEKPYVCHLCKRAFTQKGTLQIHMIRHTGVKPYQCILCSAKFYQKGNLRVHVQKTHTVLPSNIKVYQCTLCTCVFKRICSLSAHITKVHIGEHQSDGIFTEVMEQLKHLQSQMGSGTVEHINLAISQVGSETEVIEDGKASYGSITNVKLADTSSEDTIRVYSVKQRKMGQHQWYICNYCLKEFKKPSDLIRHTRVHTKEKPFKCNHCAQAFTLKSTLTNHLSVHYRSNMFQCVSCSKTFTTLRILSAHMKKHEKVVAKSIDEFTCNICNQKFTSNHEINLHMMDHNVQDSVNFEDMLIKPSGIEVIMQQPMVETAEGMFTVPAPRSVRNCSDAETMKRKHKCHLCKAMFFKSVHLKRHLLTHTDDRRFNCDFCSKCFFTSYALKEHSKFHTGQRNYLCNECGKRFITSGVLKRHMVVHSSYKPYVCPYCKRNFKTVNLCRRHINVHKKDINMEVHALNETGEIDELFNNPLNIQESMTDETYLLPTVPGELEDMGFDNMSTDTELACQIDSSNGLHQSSKVLFTDENGMIVSTTIDDDEAINGLPSNGILEPATTPGYVDDLLLSNGLNGKGLEPFTQQNVGGGYPTMFVNCEDLPPLSTSSLYTTHLSQSKIDQPLFLNGSTDLLDANLLYTANSTISTIVSENYLDTNSEEGNSVLTYNINMELAKGSAFSNPFSNSMPIEDLDCVVSSSKLDKMTNTNVIVGDTDGNKDQNEIKQKNTNSQSLENSRIVEENQNVKCACAQCKQCFNNLGDLATHICKANSKIKNKLKYEPDVIDGTYKCGSCSKSFLAESSYRKHIVTHRRKGPSSKTCTFCQRSFKKHCDLVRHTRIHTGEKPFKCEKCGKCFSLKSTLNCHYKTHNPTDKKEFPCPVCGSTFSFSSSLKVHSRIHTGSKPYPCTLCPESFRTSGNRKSHMAVHSKPLELRKSARSRKSKINSILASVVMDQNDILTPELNGNNELQNSPSVSQLLMGTDDKDVVISISNQLADVDPLLLQLNNLLLNADIDELQPIVQVDVKNNLQIATGNEIGNTIDTPTKPEEECITQVHKNVSKNFECDICHKKFCRKYVLNKHKKTHILKCTSCDIYFDTAESHENHVKLHNICRIFSCQFCANTFHSEKNLKAHLKRLHNAVLVNDLSAI